jgi:hypothetical protein
MSVSALTEASGTLVRNSDLKPFELRSELTPLRKLFGGGEMELAVRASGGSGDDVCDLTHRQNPMSAGTAFRFTVLAPVVAFENAVAFIDPNRALRYSGLLEVVSVMAVTGLAVLGGLSTV